MSKRVLSFAVAAWFAAGAAHAGVDLIARGQLDGHRGDLAVQTAAPLENGAPGNLLGGMGSSIAYTGCGDTFLALPDRGPNAIPYDAAADDTTSYIDRFQTVDLHLRPAPHGAALPFQLSPELRATTLFSSNLPLVYGDGSKVGLGPGAPALNNPWLARYYFSGRSDNFSSLHDSLWPFDARLDPESIRLANDGDSVYVSDEYGPYINQFDRRSGRRIRAIALPAAFGVDLLSPVDDEIDRNSAGRVANKGMEGLAISPDGRTLYGAMQSPLLQDGGTNGGYTRIVRIDLRTGKVRQYAYPLTNLGTAAKPKYGTISEIVAIDDHELLVDERDGKGLGDDSKAAFKQLFRIDLAHARELGALSGEAALAGAAVGKRLFLDLVAAFTAHGIAPENIPSKIEGLSFGPEVQLRGRRRHTLFVANDNDFIGTVTDDNHPGGYDNPNQFFAFAFDDDDLPGFEPQRFEHGACRRR